MAKNYFILLISFLGAVALADYAIVSGFINFGDTKIEKTESPDANVLYSLAQKYELGVEVEKDLDKAIYWYGVAADNGSTEARSRLDVLSVQAKNSKKSPPPDSPPLFDSKYKEIDDEAEKITRILEKQLAREEEKARRIKQKKKAENDRLLQEKLAKEKAEADRIRQQNEITATINREAIKQEVKVDTKTEPLATKSTAISIQNETQSSDVIDEIPRPDSVSVNSTIVNSRQPPTTTEQNSGVNTAKPLALQPSRPLSLPNTKSKSNAKTNTTAPPDDYVSAYEEGVENENPTAVSSNKKPAATSQTDEEKKFNVNPCNGPAARFMSTCR